MANRKYWIEFRVATADGKHVGQGEVAINRELPITDENSLVEIAKAIKAGFPDMPDTHRVQVISWLKFEEPSVVLASTDDVKKLLQV